MTKIRWNYFTLWLKLTVGSQIEQNRPAWRTKNAMEKYSKLTKKAQAVSAINS